MNESVLVFHPSDPEAYLEALGESARTEGLTLRAARSETEVERAIGDAEVLFSANNFPVEQLRAADRLRWIQVQGAGVNRWLDAGLPPGVRLSRTTGSFGPRMAEYALAYMLAVALRIPEALANQADRHWQELPFTHLRGSTVAVAGVGDIGLQVARACAGLGARVVGLARTPRRDPALTACYGPDELILLVREADFVVVTLPLTRATRGLFGRPVFEAMKSTAWIINMARGPILHETDLIAALSLGVIGGAVLDVFEEEPLPPDHPLWAMPNVIVTPHHSGITWMSEAVAAFCENLPRYREGAPLVHEVDLGRGY